MDTRIDTEAADEIFWHDSTLSTHRPAVATPDAGQPDEQEDGEQDRSGAPREERNIIRGED
ncbi:hypothetical protein GCM10017562_04610 [Streptomyces roseofulvus]|uniref:Regulatory protein n=2 Tax=Streptomyces TaxID=1883 RepID=A0ABU4KI09_9ACTN|nr:hypothetical protein [Streptomyces roseolus]MDX2297357.1 hypothetical protein [Streptomyces roseolus]